MLHRYSGLFGMCEMELAAEIIMDDFESQQDADIESYRLCEGMFEEESFEYAGFLSLERNGWIEEVVEGSGYYEVSPEFFMRIWGDHPPKEKANWSKFGF